jgi:dehydrogenase/reductase SDR family member 7B
MFVHREDFTGRCLRFARAMSDFKDQVIWITGASSGIGEALALQFAAKGARLVLSARRHEALARVATLTRLQPGDILVLPFDLADTSRASGFAAQVVNHFGRIDVLVNNGGVSQRATAMETSEAVERQIMEVNYFSAVNLSRAVLPYMIRQRAGRIVVVSSIAGKFGFFLRSSYSAAKHALHGYFESLRLELEPSGIKVNIVCPGKIKTEISVHAFNGSGDSHAQMDPSHEKAMSADKCAQQIVQAIISNREETFVGGRELLLIPVKRYFPGWFSRLIRRQNPF